MSLRIGIDIGGTFTDLVAIGPDGVPRTHKTSSTPHDYGEGILRGLDQLLAPGEAIGELLHATTIGSNIILQGSGAKTALITTQGFRDVLEIRDLRMPRLYDLRWTKPRALVERRLRLELRERVRSDGSVAIALNPASLAAAIAVISAEGVQSVAVCLLHSYANPAHELEVEAALHAALPEIPVTLSSRLLPEIREYPRTSTTVINAYLLPAVRSYLTLLGARLRLRGIAAPLQLMQSNGGLAAAEFVSQHPAHIVESGPAAGVVGAAAFARHLGLPQLVTFDMGGTTAKAGLVAGGAIARAEAMEVGGGVMAGSRLLAGGGYMLKLPSVDLAEVGAGGGSICFLDAAGAPKVGPESAGADPGPVCYGRGGTRPTITDCNLVLGYLDPVGLAGGALPLERGAAATAIGRALADPLGLSVEQAAEGMLKLAAATMMRAIRAVSVERGLDPRGCTLLAFGGNGPLFAARIAQEIGIGRVIVPPLPGVFSAFGLLVAEREHHLTRSLRLLLGEADPTRFAGLLEGLRAEGAARLIGDGFQPQRQAFRCTAMLRYVGQSSELAVALPDGVTADMLPGLFAEAHALAYGFRAPEGEPVELMGLALAAIGLPERPLLPLRIRPPGAGIETRRSAWFGAWREVPVLDRAALGAVPRPGPLIIGEYDATCLVPAGATAALDHFGNIILVLEQPSERLLGRSEAQGDRRVGHT